MRMDYILPLERNGQDISELLSNVPPLTDLTLMFQDTFWSHEVS